MAQTTFFCEYWDCNESMCYAGLSIDTTVAPCNMCIDKSKVDPMGCDQATGCYTNF